MNWYEVGSLVAPILTALSALLGIFISNKLTLYRITQLESHMNEHNKRIEELITVQVDMNNLKEELNEQKEIEERDRSELHKNLESLKDDIADVKEQVNKLQISVTKLEGEIANVRVLIKAHHKEM